MAEAATAPAMTNARAGSQAPATSRKASTRAGLTMSDSARPAPKTSPVRREGRVARISASDQMAGDEDGHGRGRHERDGRGNRTYRQAPYSADAVTTGAAVAEPRSKADQQAGGQQQGHRRRHLDVRLPDEQRHDKGADRQSDDERSGK